MNIGSHFFNHEQQANSSLEHSSFFGLERRLVNTPIEYFPEVEIPKGNVSRDLIYEKVKERLGDDGEGCKIYVCDTDVENITNGTRQTYGYEDGDIVNIDHHIPSKEMERAVSTTNLVIEYLAAHQGQAIKKDKNVVLINHKDADAVLSALILSGVLNPEPGFGEAAVAADHTGEENGIADLLQAIEHEGDLEFSVRNLGLYLSGNAVELRAAELVEGRLAERKAMRDLVENGKFQLEGNIAYGVFDGQSGDAAFLPALLPDSMLILAFNPLGADPTDGIMRWAVKIRAGVNVPEGFSLKDPRLGLQEIDPEFSGRWNAGSNKAKGVGTALSPSEYVEKVGQKLEEYLALFA